MAMRVGKLAGRIVVSIIAFVAMAAILAQAALWAGAGWLNTASGRDWVVRRVDGALARAGYTIELQGLHVLALKGFGVDRVVLSDAAGPVAEGAHVWFYTELLPVLASRRLPLSLTADEVTLHRLPASSAPHAQAPGTGVLMKPFRLPDLYVRTVDLQHFAIGRLALDAPVAGRAMVLSPKLAGRASARGNHIRFELTGGSSAAEQPAFVPQSLHVRGMLNGDDATLSLDDLSVTAKAYTVTGKGVAGLDRGGTLAMEFHAGSDDLTTLAAMPGNAKMTVLVGGTGDNPTLEISGTARPSDMVAKGLGDITLAAHADNLTGDVRGRMNIGTTYRQRAVALSLNFTYAAPFLHIADVALTAPDISVAGQADFNTKSSLAAGTITAAFKLDGYKDLIGAALAGQGRANIVLSAPDGRQAAMLEANANGLRYQTMAARTITLSASLSDVRSPWPDAAKLSLTDASAGDIALDRLAASVSKKDTGAYSLALDGGGRFRQPFTLAGAANLKGTDAASARADDIVLKFGASKGTLAVRGNIAPDRLALAFDAARLPLAALPVALPPAAAGLTLSGNGTLDGMLNAPHARAALQFSPLTAARGAPAVTIAVQASYADGKAMGTLRGTGRGIDMLQGQGAAPMTLSLKPFAFAMPGNTPLSATVAARLDVASVAGAVLPPGEFAKGRVNAQASIGGTLAKPDMAGTVAMTGGDFTDEGAGIALHAIDARTTLKRDIVTLAAFRATDGKRGTVSGSGTIGLGADAAADLKFKAASFNPFIGTAQVKGDVSAELALTGRKNAYALKGTIAPGALDITIPERFGSSVPQLNIVDTRRQKRQESEPLKTVALNMAVHAPNQIFVRGWGLDAEFGGDLSITGSLAAPLIDGTLAAKRGRYEEFNKRFDLTRANLRFQGAVPPSPYLDIEAQTKADTITAVIDLTGTAKEPKIALSSVPALPQDEVLAHILFGKDMNKISPFQAIQLAGTLQRFTGHGGGPGLLDTLRSRTGLDDLSVSNDDAGGTTVGAGKYITDKVYVQAGGGAAKNSGAVTVKYEVSPHVTIDSKVSQDAQAGGGVSWSWDY